MCRVLPSALKTVSPVTKCDHLSAGQTFGSHDIDVIKLCLLSSAVMAASAIANVVKSSLGPIGLDKMLVDDIGVSVKLFQRLLHLIL